MKSTILCFVVCLFGASQLNAQLKAKVRCDPFDVDILNGKVNGLKPNVGFAEITEKFPCSTSTEAEGSTAKCGGTISFADKGLTFYTTRDYVEIKQNFKGKLSLPLMGAKRNSFFKSLGNPKIKDDSWDAFQMQYGTLVLHYDKAGKVNLIQFSTMTTDVLNLCE